MKEFNDGFNVYIDVDNKQYVLPITLVGLLDNEELLLKLSMKELFELFSKYYGIPDNFKDYLIKKIKLYDDSEGVNSFIFNGEKFWLDKSLRNSLFNLFSNSDPEEEFEVVFGNITIKQKAEIFSKFLKNLEKYAYECFIVTQKHLNAVNAISEPNDKESYKLYLDLIINYDYTSEYPEKLKL